MGGRPRRGGREGGAVGRGRMLALEVGLGRRRRREGCEGGAGGGPGERGGSIRYLPSLLFQFLCTVCKASFRI